MDTIIRNSKLLLFVHQHRTLCFILYVFILKYDEMFCSSFDRFAGTTANGNSRSYYKTTSDLCYVMLCPLPRAARIAITRWWYGTSTSPARATRSTYILSRVTSAFHSYCLFHGILKFGHWWYSRCVDNLRFDFENFYITFYIRHHASHYAFGEYYHNFKMIVFFLLI